MKSRVSSWQSLLGECYIVTLYETQIPNIIWGTSCIILYVQRDVINSYHSTLKDEIIDKKESVDIIFQTLSMFLGKWPTWRTIFSMYLSSFLTLYMLRAHRAHHQGRQILSIQPLVAVTLCRLLCRVQVGSWEDNIRIDCLVCRSICSCIPDSQF